MEALTQADDQTFKQARKQAALTQAKKGMHKLEKGVSRFVDRNGRLMGVVTVAGATLVATGQLVSRRNARRSRLLPRLNESWSAARKPLRRVFQSRQWEVSPALAIGGLVCAGALLGTGVMMLFSPRTFMGRMRQS